jgi:hypothetical protein
MCFNLPTSKTAFDNLIEVARIANVSERVEVNRLRAQGALQNPAMPAPEVNVTNL